MIKSERIQRVTVHGHSSIAVYPGERFTVKDGMGNVVEIWHHHHTDHGKHYYDVQGYSHVSDV